LISTLKIFSPLLFVANFSIFHLRTVQNLAGNAGDLNINTENLFLRNGVRIKTSTFNAGSAGNLKIEALESIELIGVGLTPNGLTSSGLFTQTEGSGLGGNLRVSTRRLDLQDGASISAQSQGIGNAGDIDIHLGNNLMLSI
jgi:large exoprotein involved in heme utilization and adhesion